MSYDIRTEENKGIKGGALASAIWFNVPDKGAPKSVTAGAQNAVGQS
jgi:hypothetical protein